MSAVGNSGVLHSVSSAVCRRELETKSEKSEHLKPLKKD